MKLFSVQNSIFGFRTEEIGKSFRTEFRKPILYGKQSDRASILKLTYAVDAHILGYGVSWRGGVMSGISKVRETSEALINETGKIIIGKRKQLELIMTAIICGGHVLLEDLPGSGKTTLSGPLPLPSDVTGNASSSPLTFCRLMWWEPRYSTRRQGALRQGWGRSPRTFFLPTR